MKNHSEVEKIMADVDALLHKSGKKRSPGVLPVLIVLCVIGALAAGMWYVLQPAPGEAVRTPQVTTCDSRACFVERAEACLPIRYVTRVETATFELVTSNDCVLVKRIIAIDPSEPPEVRRMFEGKAMTCIYTKGDFDRSYLDMISGNIVPCSGALVDAIMAVL